MKDNESGSLAPPNDANTTATADAGKPNGDDANASDADKNADGTPKVASKDDKPEGITPEIQKYLDSQAAAARRAGEAKGKQTKEQEIEAAKADAAKAAALQAGQHKELYDTEVKDHSATKATLTATESELNKLKAALASQVPNPLDNYKRIVGDDYDAMVEDAKTLAASFGTQAHRDPATPPVVPNTGDGGKHDQKPAGDDKVTTDDLAKERAKYNVL